MISGMDATVGVMLLTVAAVGAARVQQQTLGRWGSIVVQS
jgi:hypothetical protein